MSEQNELYVGIDVSQETLDVAFSDGRMLKLENAPAGFEALTAALERTPARLVLMEATGAWSEHWRRSSRPQARVSGS